MMKPMPSPPIRDSFALLLILGLLCPCVFARPSFASPRLAPSARLKLDIGHAERPFNPGSIGLSTEALELSAGHLTAGDTRLVRLMRMMGPSVLRIVGDAPDSSWWTSDDEPAPIWATSTTTPADLYTLRELLHATGWRVLLTLALGHFAPARAADEAHYAQSILGGALLGVEIGNEPDEYSNSVNRLRPRTYNLGDYLSESEAYREALTVDAPGLALYGPDLSQTSWLTMIGTDAANYAEVTQHYYPTSICPLSSRGRALPDATAQGLLSIAVRQQESQVLEVLTRAGAIAGRPTRIGETNNVSCGGSISASPVFASALWAMDWVLRATSKGVTGLNFNADIGVCYRGSYSPICAPTQHPTEADLVVAQPEYYGLLAARQLEGGRFIPTGISAPTALPNLTTWATITNGGTIKIAIDNLAVAGFTQPISIPTAGYAATVQRLSAPSVAATGDITLAGVPITREGEWHPRFQGRPTSQRSLRVLVRPASAVIVTLRQR
jgi:hypothetical protein